MRDHILRQRLKILLKEKRRKEVERKVNLANGMAVPRIESDRMFGKNPEKIVESRLAPKREFLAEVQKEFLRCWKRKSNDEHPPNKKRSNYRL